MKTIREMAREAGAEEVAADNGDYFEGCTAFSDLELERFAALVREEAIADEREACAKVCDDFERAKWESVKNISENGGRLAFAGPMHCATTIRARSNT